MLHSEEFGAVAGALAKAQGAFKTIEKNKTVKVKTRTGGEYTFSYAPLETIMAAVRGSLAANELGLTQGVVVTDKGEEMLRTTLIHASGQWIANEVPVLVAAGENGAQAYGSALTYARRYAITAILCVVADEDDDGNLAEGNGVERVSRPQRAHTNGATATYSKAKPAYADEEEVAGLRDRLEAIGKDPAAFAKFMGIKSGKLSELPAAQLESAKAQVANAERVASKKKAEPANDEAVDPAAEVSA